GAPGKVRAQQESRPSLHPSVRLQLSGFACKCSRLAVQPDDEKGRSRMPRTSVHGDAIGRSGVQWNCSVAGLINVYLVDNHQLLAESLSEVLEKDPDLTVVGISSQLTSAQARIAEAQPHVVLLSYFAMQDADPFSASKLQTNVPGIKIVVLTSRDD